MQTQLLNTTYNHIKILLTIPCTSEGRKDFAELLLMVLKPVFAELTEIVQSVSLEIELSTSTMVPHIQGKTKYPKVFCVPAN